MKKLLIALLSVLVLAGCTAKDENTLPYEIDPVATASAPWKVGDIIWETSTRGGYYFQLSRVFIGMTTDGGYLVRDEYYGEHRDWHEMEDDLKNLIGNERTTNTRSAPYKIVDANSLRSSTPIIDGKYVSFYDTGEKRRECDYENGGTSIGPCIAWYRSGEKMSEIWFVNGQMQKSVLWYINGQKITERSFNINSGDIQHIREWDTKGNLIREENLRPKT